MSVLIFILLSLFLISILHVGLKLTTPRSRVACSFYLGRQAGAPAFLFKDIDYETKSDSAPYGIAVVT